ncbi:MAG: lyase family protein, partial [Candidatus Zixiibacteriota bacterium]
MIPRYTLPEMGALWSEQAKFDSWLQVEIEAARAMGKYKVIPMGALRTIEGKARFDIKRIDEIEQEVDHDVIAFLTAVAEHVGDAGRYLHYGMTSSDVLDTALALRLKQAARIVDKKIAQALKQIRHLALKHRMTACIARTHGVLAEPTTVGMKLAVWYTELSRGRERFKQATE